VLLDVTIHPQALNRFRPIVGRHRQYRADRLAGVIRDRLAGRTLWNVNSTAVGGGVAEMLRVLLPYVRDAGADARWLVIEGAPAFFHVTKRLHHALHGSRGDGSPLAGEARAAYEATMRANLPDLAARIRPHDVVILHDPQTAGLAPQVLEAGALVIWRSHIGHDGTDPEVERGWAFLTPYLQDVPAFVFSRRAYVPARFRDRTTIITPSIDAFSAKNQALDDASVRAILVHAGLVEGPPGQGRPAFVREDDTPAEVTRQADVVRLGRAPTWDTPLVVQVSRWDPLKDMAGVMRGFAAAVERGAVGAAELVLAGPNVRAVADDPEGAAVFDEVLAAWRDLPHETRGRVHLASLPMADVEENAAIVNALQRHAAIVVQKSLHEGFGLTVTEAMWKARPVVASAVGGIQDQIDDGVHGLLLRDPTDLDAFGTALARLLADPGYARALGENARERVRERFLGIGHLVKYARLIERLERARTGGGGVRHATGVKRTRRSRR
jgi:trehalose synthase